jgi:hypothetical protein
MNTESSGIISSRQHIRYVLSGKRACGHNDQAEGETETPESCESAGFLSTTTSKEVSHV